MQLTSGLPTRDEDHQEAPVDLGALLRDAVEGRRRLRAVLDHLPAMVGYWDRDLRNQVANRAYLEWFGWEPEDLPGRHISELLGPELFAQNEPFMRAALDGQDQHFDRAITDPSGQVRYSQTSYIPDRDDGGVVVGFFVLVTDVTAKVVAEQQARSLTERLRVVSRVSASAHAAAPDEVLARVVEGLIELDFDGANVAVLDARADAFVPRYTRGIFTAFEDLAQPLADSLTGDVVRTGTCIAIDDYQTASNPLHAIRRTGVRATVSAPIRVDGRVIAVLHAGSVVSRKISEADVELLSLLADVAGVALAKGQQLESLARKANRAVEDSLTDSLTGTGNRRAADLALADAESGDVFVMLDLDHFKAVNDFHGHARGDQELRTFVRALTDCLRGRDRLYRLGGEEFLIVLPAVDLAAASSIVSRLHQAWSSTSPLTTFSAGLSQLHGSEGTEDTIERADRALYLAKHNGRNRDVIIRSPNAVDQEQAADPAGG